MLHHALGHDRTASSAAVEVGIHHTLLSRWVRRYGQLAGSATTATASLPPRQAMASSLKPVPVPHADQAAEITRLRRENERLRMECDILKKGMVGSTGRRNGLGEGSGWCLEAKRLPWPDVERERDRIEVGMAVR